MDKKLFLVETLVQYKVRYVVSAKSASDANNEVIKMESGNREDIFNEFSQRCLGEIIIGNREISIDEFDILNEELKTNGDNGSPWLGKEIIRQVKYED